MATDLHAAIRAELARREAAMEYGNEALVGDLLGVISAVLGDHPHVAADGGHYTKYDFGCATCHNDPDCGTTNGHGWCDTTLAIAAKLGIPNDGEQL